MINLKNKPPTTIDEAISSIVKELTPKEIEYIINNDANSVHHFLGRHIRNSWGLWDKNSPIVEDFKKRFELWGMADDISGLILSQVWAYVRGLDMKEEMDKEINSYFGHWLRSGVDPKTGEEIKNFKQPAEIKLSVDKDGKIEYID